MRVSGRSPWQRIVSLALCLAMLLSFLPATARAVEGTASAPVQLTAEQEPVSQEKQSADPELLADWLEQYEQESLEPLGLSGVTLPEYETADGLVSRTMTYDCGNAVTGDGSKSFLTVVTGTTAGEFEGYKSLLAENGYVLDQEWTVEARDGGENLFAIYQDASGTEPKDYPFEVVLKPNAPATDNENDPGNIAGDPVDPAGKTAADNGHIFVLVPEVTFKDSVTEPGTPTAGYDYENEDLVSVEWELMPDGKTPAADMTSMAPAASSAATRPIPETSMSSGPKRPSPSCPIPWSSTSVCRS